MRQSSVRAQEMAAAAFRGIVKWRRACVFKKPRVVSC
jgi:hypothetical protein